VDKKILVVGAGLTGATIARKLAEAGNQVNVIDKRGHIAGNCYDYTNEYGIRVHKYGPHIFHTNNQSVYYFLQTFTDFVPYKHKVKALLSDGRYATLPPNKETAEMVGGKHNVIETFYRPYSEKMWGVPLEEISPDILDRVKIRDDDNEFYFPNDLHQYMPLKGYTHMVETMLDHYNISIDLNVEFNKNMEKDYNHVFNSMPIDVYYDLRFGELTYRSIKFHDFTLPLPNILPTGTVNFTHRAKYTRVTEWKNFPCHGKNQFYTTLTFEEPCDYKQNNDERYYPFPSQANRDKYEQYRAIENDKVTFVGRCGTYAYIDMHQAVNMGLQVSKKFIESRR